MESEELLKNIRLLEKHGLLNSQAYRKFGVKFFSELNYGLAKEFFEKSYLLGGDLISFCNLGVVVGKYFNDHTRANEIFEEVIKKDEKMPLAYYNSACNKIRLGDFEGAIKYLGKAIELGAEEYRSTASKDPAFRPIAEDPEFKKLVPAYDANTEELDVKP